MKRTKDQSKRRKPRGAESAAPFAACSGSAITSDTERLEWVARCLYEINTLDAPKDREKVEIIWWHDDENDREVTTRSGRDYAEAFRRAVDAAIREQRERSDSPNDKLTNDAGDQKL